MKGFTVVFFGLILSCFIASTTSDLALADPSTIVYEGFARFTILSAQLIRLEWSSTKEFVDAKTWVVQSRQIQSTSPTFNVTRNETHLIIQTSFLTVEYQRNTTTTFNQRNIRVTIRVNDRTVVVWNAVPGEEYDGNLLGTIRTLDRNNDSKLDIILTNEDTNSISVLLGHGNGTFSTVKLLQLEYGTNPFSTVFGNFNDDKKLDMAVANNGSDSLSILLRTC